MFCKNCGKELKEGAAFCNQCGAKIVPLASTPNSVVDNQPAPTVLSPNQSEEVAQEKTDKGIVLIVIVVLALVLAVGGVAAGLMYMMGVGPFESSYSSYDDDDDDDDDNEDNLDKEDEEETAEAPADSTDSTVDPIAEVKSDFIIADSDSRLLTEADLAGLTPQELSIARNEIYARHGYIFTKTPEWNDYFSRFEWYVQTSTEVPLSSIEQTNAAFILDYQKDNGLEWNWGDGGL